LGGIFVTICIITFTVIFWIFLIWGGIGAEVFFYVSSSRCCLFIDYCVMWCLAFGCRGFMGFFFIFVLVWCMWLFFICKFVYGRFFWWVVFVI
jgi:hypothetical protein